MITFSAINSPLPDLAPKRRNYHWRVYSRKFATLHFSIASIGRIYQLIQGVVVTKFDSFGAKAPNLPLES